MTQHLVDTSLAAQNDNDSQIAYEPYLLSQRTARKIMILDGEGKVIGMPSYAHYVDVICTSPHYLWIVFSTNAFRLKGEHLPEQIIHYLQEDRIRQFQVFDRKRFLTPEEGTPMIHSITRHALKDYLQSQEHEAPTERRQGFG